MRKADFRLVASALCMLKGGRVEVRTGHAKSLVVTLGNDTIDLDFHDPYLFRAGERKIGIMDSLKEMKSLGKVLADKDVTLSISRKNSPILKIGREAKPSLSLIATRSKDIQILNLKELRKLDKELSHVTE